MEHKETLKSSALVGELPHSIEAEVHNFFANGVMATGVVVSGILFASDELLLHWSVRKMTKKRGEVRGGRGEVRSVVGGDTYRMEELAIGSCPYLVNNSWLQVQENGPWYMLARVGLREESVEGVIPSTNGLHGG